MILKKDNQQYTTEDATLISELQRNGFVEIDKKGKPVAEKKQASEE